MSKITYASCVWLHLVGLCLAAASGCAMFRSDAQAADTALKAASASDVQQASFEPTAEKDDGLTLSDLSPDNLGKTAKKLTGNGPNKEIAQKLFDEAEAQYKQAAAAAGASRPELFQAAGDKFAAAAARYPGSSLEQDALYYAAESYFFADRYHEANKHYEKLIKAYPNNRYLDTVDQRRFAIAKYWLDLTRKEPEPFYYFNWFDNKRPWRDARGGALRLFDKIRVDDPTGKLADDATIAAANENLLAGKYMKADEYYTDLRKAYPTSEHQFLAHFLGLKAKLNSYLGPNYSGASLDEAEKLIKQMRRQFPVDAAKEKEFLDRANAEIRYKKAEKVWLLGEYYHKRSEYRAAQTHYARLLKEYNDTPFARRAEQRIEKTADLPAVPPQKLPWLVNLLPQSDKVKPLLAASQQAKRAEQQPAERNGQIARGRGEEPSAGGAVVVKPLPASDQESRMDVAARASAERNREMEQARDRGEEPNVGSEVISNFLDR